MIKVLTDINDFVWGVPLITLLLGTGIYLTYQLKFIQFIKLKQAFQCIFKKSDGSGDVSSFQALCTALSSTIGTGNIVGVATAIHTGGPGAMLWMWVSAFFGMATKYAEGLLAIKYRVRDEHGQMAGGPMYYLEKGLKKPFLAKLFAFFGTCVALFGIGTFAQVKAISDALTLTFQIPQYITAILLTICVAFITIGGIKRIANVAEKIVPIMCLFYIVGVSFIIITHFHYLLDIFYLIINEAISFKAIVGGSVGIAIQKGISRGIFSNESGLGSAPIAAAASKSDSCVEQGLVSMTGTFIDTIIVCTMTGLAILLTDAHKTGLSGSMLTTYAFDQGFFIPHLGKYIVNIGLIFFAFTTIIGWNYYGERCIYYLKGIKAIKIYKIIFIIAVGIGSFISFDFIFILADIFNGCMAIPNLIGLLGLRKEIIKETNLYFKK